MVRAPEIVLGMETGDSVIAAMELVVLALLPESAELDGARRDFCPGCLVLAGGRRTLIRSFLKFKKR
jgi:hypothetical protein